jgi:hypothetical protein
MTTEDMVKDFTEQLKEQKASIVELEAALTNRKNQVLRLEGAIEALNMTLKQAEVESDAEVE